MKCDEPYCRSDVSWNVRVESTALPKWHESRCVCSTHAGELKREIAAGDVDPSRFIAAYARVNGEWEAL